MLRTKEVGIVVRPGDVFLVESGGGGRLRRPAEARARGPRLRPRERLRHARPAPRAAGGHGAARRAGAATDPRAPRAEGRADMYRIGIDVGGTFTDLVAVDERGRVTLAKAASTPQDQSLGVMDGLEPPGRRRCGCDRAALLRDTERIVHGTTVATNALLERKGARVGLLTTAGHRDVIEMREGLKDDRYNLRMPPPEPLVPRARRLGVRERMRADGRVETPLDPALLDAGHRRPQARRRRGGRRLLPARLPGRAPRAGDRARAPPGAAGRLRLALLRGAAADQGVRARLHDRGQRLRRPGALALSLAPGRAARPDGLRRARAHHPVPRRRGADRRRRAARRRRRSCPARRAASRAAATARGSSARAT